MLNVWLLSSWPVPAHPVTLHTPDDVIEGEVVSFTCTGIVDTAGRVALVRFDDVTGEYRDISIGEMTSDVVAIDECKVQHNVTYSLTLDMTFNSTKFQCQTDDTESEKHTVLVIRGNYKVYPFGLCLYYIIYSIDT